LNDPSLFDNEFYKVRLKGINSQFFTDIEILREGYFRLGIMLEEYNVDFESGSILDDPGTTIPGTDLTSLGGINAELYLDLRDKRIFSTRGIQFSIKNTVYTNIQSSDNFGLAESYLKYFGTARILLPITLVAKIGGSINYGENIPFYKYAFLGQFNNLRGYRRNRFTGDASAYLNTELRFHFGKVRNHFIPFEMGVIGFYDLGKVWFEGNDNGGWHPGYGGGFYIAPLAREYVFSFLLESSPEENILFKFGMGFILDR
jgi:outer membrane protein assembly factor BamA